MTSRRYIVAAILVSLVGFAFCLANLFGADLLCVTEGCALYHGYRILGLNLYALGAAGFFVTALLLLLSPRYSVAPLLGLVIACGLLIETALLVYQVLFWVCSSCLVAALLFGLAALLAALAFPELQRRWLFCLGGLWLVFALFVTLAVAKETLFKPWAPFGGKGPIQVYFSPTCPSCREAVLNILNCYPDADKVTFIPVSKGAEDDRRLAAVLPLLGQPGRGAEALRLIFEPLKPAAAPQELSLGNRLRLLSNKICLASRGFTTIPQILSPFPVQVSPPAAAGQPQRSSDLPLFLDQDRHSCSPFNGQSCP